MRFCFVSSVFGSPWAGSELLWCQAASAALDDGHEVACVVKNWEKLARNLADLGARGARLFLRKVNLDRRSSRIFERVVHPFPAIARWRPDVVCVSLGNFGDAARPDISRFLAKLRAPYILIIQQHYENSWLVPDDYTRERMKRLFTGAERVAFVSERNRSSAVHQLATDLPNARVVCNPITVPNQDPVPWPGPGIARFACVARLDASDKGQDLLFATLAADAWRSRDWVLRLFGEGRHRRYLEDLAAYCGIADRVEFRGHTPDIRGIWADNEMLLLPSRCEGTPIGLIEAMIWGRPAVVTDVGGNAEWVSEPRNGFVAEAASVKSYAAAMERAWEARERWSTLGARARDDALALYDPDPARSLLGLMAEASRAGAHPSTAASP